MTAEELNNQFGSQYRSRSRLLDQSLKVVFEETTVCLNTALAVDYLIMTGEAERVKVPRVSIPLSQ